ncbi:hypothetical protein DBR06_SOUSAS42110001, partial [Sousa chinensis]
MADETKVLENFSGPISMIGECIQGIQLSGESMCLFWTEMCFLEELYFSNSKACRIHKLRSGIIFRERLS